MNETGVSRTGVTQTPTPAVQPGLEPIVKSLSVSLPVEAAFRLFTQDIDRWWPLKSHSVGGEDAATCIVEGWAGGRFYEVQKDGSQSEWGRLLAWEPPHRLVSTFYPGRTPEYATEVEVTFQPEGGGTRVTLTHRGWERCAELTGESAFTRRNGYASGWDVVLGEYVKGTVSYE
jgi:uncharacterized protein YndB with AHSA1/START domain